MPKKLASFNATCHIIIDKTESGEIDPIAASMYIRKICAQVPGLDPVKMSIAMCKIFLIKEFERAHNFIDSLPDEYIKIEKSVGDSDYKIYDIVIFVIFTFVSLLIWILIMHMLT